MMAILLVAIFSKKTKMLCLVLIVLSFFLHDYFMHETPAVIYDYYYFSSALLDVSLIFIIAWLFERKEVLRYNVFLTLCILGNFAGWLIWYFYLPSKIYNIYFILLYAGLLITEGLDNVGGNRLYLPFRAFLLNGYQRSIKRDSGEN